MERGLSSNYSIIVGLLVVVGSITNTLNKKSFAIGSICRKLKSLKIMTTKEHANPWH